MSHASPDPAGDLPRARAAAHGKIILLGEHTVVHGAPAIAAGIERGARATAAASAGSSTLDLGGRRTTASPEGEDVARAFAALLDAPTPEDAPSSSSSPPRRTLPPIHVCAESDLPAGGGLGSSAALGVAIARAVEGLAFPGVTPSPDIVLARARAWESVFHGMASGIDTAAAALGGCFRFTRRDGVRPLAPARDLWVAVGWTGTASSTRTMVEAVARLQERKPDLVETTKVAVTSLVDNAALALSAGDLTGLGRLMDLNQMLLAGLMVSNEAIELLCRAAREAGALGAKLTGAGGGGSVIALAPSARLGAPDVSEEDAARAAEGIVSAWRGAGYEGFVTRVHAASPRSSAEVA